MDFFDKWYGILTAILVCLIVMLFLSSILYKQFFKRLYDVLLSLIALVALSPLFLLLTILGVFRMKGNPFFIQLRPGKNEKIFKLIKFRTMTCEKDENGNFLPDEKRLTKYGKGLRSLSLDELPELWNIIKGDMSIVGPRPLLIKDLVFMNDEIRKRHCVRGGLTGLAQVSGRNNISWQEKFDNDLYYLHNISFWFDLKIILKTILKVVKRTDIAREGTVSDTDYGDYLLQELAVSKDKYDEKIEEVKEKLKAV